MKRGKKLKLLGWITRLGMNDKGKLPFAETILKFIHKTPGNWY